jgi:hypothetical protein
MAKGMLTVENETNLPNLTTVTDHDDEAAAAKLWAVYVSEAEKYDKSLVESWKSDMEGLLIFVSDLIPMVTIC